VTVKQADAAGNTSEASAAFDLKIVAPPVALVDGVAVTQQAVSLPGGGSGTQVNVPIVTGGRVDSSGTPGVADIPLATDGAGNLLTAQVATGLGLTASGGTSQPAGNSLAQLIATIIASTPDHAPSDQQHLTGNGQTFLKLLPTQIPLLVESVKATADPLATNATLTLNGTSSTSQHTALVIDTADIGAANKLALHSVDFAAIIGAATVTGDTSGQILTGDVANQTFVVASNQASSVFAGGGNDNLAFTAATTPTSLSAPDAGTHADVRPAAATMLHGGLGTDTATFCGAMSAYTIDNHDGYVVVTENGGAHGQAYVVNVESLQFADTSVAVQNRDALSTIAGLYQTALGRQADLYGFEYWSNAQKAGVSLGQIAIDMIDSAETDATQHAFNGNAAHDIAALYNGIFGRQQDGSGAAFWLNAMQHGMSLGQVADAFMHSTEIVGLKLAAAQWDFGV
jgi:hypothetical protein